MLGLMGYTFQVFIHHETFLCLSYAFAGEFLYSMLSYVSATLVHFLADDPYAVADKWLLKENLPLTYRQQVVEFILQNSGQNNFVPDPSFRDPYTGGKLCFFSYCHICCWLLLPAADNRVDYVPGNAYVPGGQPSSSNGTNSISMLKY